MKWFALMLVLLPLRALSANLVIPAEPSHVEIPDVKFYRVSYGFQEDDTGRFQLQVNFRYRKWASRIQRVKHLTFRLQFGEIVQRDEKTLVLQLENREMVVGQHRWWYSPYWQPADKVRIACDRSRGLRSVVIENCRLIMKNHPLGVASTRRQKSVGGLSPANAMISADSTDESLAVRRTSITTATP